METKRRPIQIYAMLVNVVAIIAFIISASAMISAVIDRGDPINSGWSNIDLSSFGKYKMDVLKSTSATDAYVPTDQEIRDMYNAARDEKVARVMHQTYRSTVVSSIIIVIAIVLFVFHWMILRKYARLDEG